jgi:hypothetical protein
LEQWMLIVFLGVRYFYHLSWGFICQMRGLFIRSGGEIDWFGGLFGRRYRHVCCIKWQWWVSDNKHNNKHCSTITAVTHTAVDEVFLVLKLWKVLQQGCNENNGKEGNFLHIVITIILLYCVELLCWRTDWYCN